MRGTFLKSDDNCFAKAPVNQRRALSDTMFILRKNACAPQRMSDSHSSDSESETKAPPVKAPRVTAPQDEATATLHVEDCVKTLRRLPAGECALVLADPPGEGVGYAPCGAVRDDRGV